MDTDQNRTLSSSDDSTHSDFEGDNLHREETENSANGLDSNEIRDGQNGRNTRAMGSQDMDSQNGVLRMGDMDNSTMEVTQEGADTAATSANHQTNTSTVSVTTAGPDDYASDPMVDVPNAQREAKKQDQNQTDDTDSSVSQEETDNDVANTGTSTNHQPTY